MSQEHEQPRHMDASVSESIHPEAAPFEPGYQPDTLPKISVPDLAHDAEGITAEALAQVPTLTELVEETPVKELITEPQTVHSVEPETVAIQDEPTQADTWVEELHVRMGKLTGDIHNLNARLDRLENRNKTKA
jgi:hypothetical protein